ncbi:MAG: hypothetical protein IT371_04500 [Deltaproteobacteria bacterium]|nr:hypothetical protein [Deltaproteobacteria bacterium]
MNATQRALLFGVALATLFPQSVEARTPWAELKAQLGRVQRWALRTEPKLLRWAGVWPRGTRVGSAPLGIGDLALLAAAEATHEEVGHFEAVDARGATLGTPLRVTSHDADEIDGKAQAPALGRVLALAATHPGEVTRIRFTHVHPWWEQSVEVFSGADRRWSHDARSLLDEEGFAGVELEMVVLGRRPFGEVKRVARIPARVPARAPLAP